MSLINITLADSATSIAVTGGTTKTYSPDGQSVSNGVHVSDGSVSDFRLKPHITWKNRNPVRQNDGSYSKGRKDVILTIPVLDTVTNKVEFSTYRFVEEYSTLSTAAARKNGRYLMAQCLFDADAENFHVNGDIS